MKQGFFNFLARVLSTEKKNLFMIRLGTSIVLSRFGIVGPIAAPISFLFRGLLGVLYEEGIYSIDVTIDAYKEAQKMAEFKEEAKKAYDETIKRVYDETEKAKIRQDYLKIIDRITRIV